MTLSRNHNHTVDLGESLGILTRSGFVPHVHTHTYIYLDIHVCVCVFQVGAERRRGLVSPVILIDELICY